MSTEDEISALLGQMDSLANFMYVDGRGAFEILPEKLATNFASCLTR